ncbi:ubiquitin carboxyl-terminal hydrolase 50-like isoform X7 [Genypterus blacodes]|uniref:ubiquitin carboxyl-terminal hydrolase 50-like isoform X7 n=1 Tax=Genypterus blacodes TaxID=154954 RepID=UPI003F774F95
MFVRHTIVRVCNCNSTNRLETLFSQEPRHISQHLEPPVRVIKERTTHFNKQDNMNYLPKYFQCRPGQKYNQGSTDYLNSVLQVLYMTDDFREAVDRHAKENPDTECVDRQLKTLFDDLKQHDAYTYLITKKLGIQKVFEQCDAAEYYEKILSLTSAEASQLFHGQLTHRFICVCGAETNTHDAFWSLPLALTDSTSYDYNVVQGIKEFFRDTEVKGENQLYCDTCDAKADATVKCEMKHHPEVLMLLLKRFELDYQYMRYVKINCCVDVPRILQIPKNQAYELYAIVDHCGDLRSGHYTATIQSQEDKTWYKFNDADVRPNFQLFQEKMTEKSTSAYLLFYKKERHHPRTFPGSLRPGYEAQI